MEIFDILTIEFTVIVIIIVGLDRWADLMSSSGPFALFMIGLIYTVTHAAHLYVG